MDCDYLLLLSDSSAPRSPAEFHAYKHTLNIAAHVDMCSRPCYLYILHANMILLQFDITPVTRIDFGSSDQAHYIPS